MKKFDYRDNKFIIEYDFNYEHLETLFIIKSNDGYVAFENRDITCEEDLDGNEISWNICDDLVDMGILKEDEISMEVGYNITSIGEELVNIIKSK